MRKINEVVVHCTATPEGRDFTIAQIDAMHRQRGFDGIGYHYLIGLDGTVRDGRPVWKAGAHVAGRNANTIGISYVGGVDRAGRPKDTRTAAQKHAMRELLVELCLDYPDITLIEGHRAYANKACPCFDARKEYADITGGKKSPKPEFERYRVKGAVSLLSEPMGDASKPLPKNAVIETTGGRSGDWLEVTHQGKLGWVHDGQVNQTEVAKPAMKSRTLLGNVTAGGGALGTAFTSIAQALGVLRDAAPWILGISVALTVLGITLSTLAKMQDDDAGVQK